MDEHFLQAFILCRGRLKDMFHYKLNLKAIPRVDIVRDTNLLTYLLTYLLTSEAIVRRSSRPSLFHCRGSNMHSHSVVSHC